MYLLPPLFRRGGQGEIALKITSLSLRRERVRVRVGT
jgi:hypothetical protein